jgi:lipopolysaccharide biosynthesis regulator YciM
MAHAYLGHELLRSGARDTAVSLARAADQLAHTGVDFAHVAGLYHDLGEFQSAIERYGYAERQGCKNVAAIYAAVADCYFSLGDENAVREYLRRAEECGSTNGYVREVSERIRGSR